MLLDTLRCDAQDGPRAEKDPAPGGTTADLGGAESPPLAPCAPHPQQQQGRWLPWQHVPFTSLTCSCSFQTEQVLKEGLWQYQKLQKPVGWLQIPLPLSLWTVPVSRRAGRLLKPFAQTGVDVQRLLGDLLTGESCPCTRFLTLLKASC